MYISNVNSATIKLSSISIVSLMPHEPLTLLSNELLIYYISKGAGHCRFDNRSQEIKKRDIIIINPGTNFTIEPTRKIECIRIVLSGVLFTSTMGTQSEHNSFITSSYNPALKHYLHLALLEEENRFRGSDLILKKLVECVLIHVLRHNELSIKDSSSQTKHNEIDTLQEYIHEHYSEKITLELLSNLVKINKYYLIRLFKQQTGLSPIDYLIHVRLEAAEKLLTKTTITVSEISDLVGFHSPSHFSKTFKENNHFTPSAYRKKYATYLQV